MKKTLLSFGMAAACAAGAEIVPVTGPWTFKNYENRLSFATNALPDGAAFAVNGATNDCDTAWHARSPKIPVAAGAAEFALAFEVKCEQFTQDSGSSGESWNNALAWYDAAGKKIGAQAFPHAVTGPSRAFQPVREWGKIPAGAAYAVVQVGFDSPNVKPREQVLYRNFTFECAPAGQSRAAAYEKAWNGGAWIRDMLYPKPQKPVISARLRDDGMAIVNGRLFFPIGIYSVCKREFNGMNFDKAFADLKAAGFNFAHTYGNAYDPEFLDAAAKHGFLLWVAARIPDARFLEKGRWNPNILAWYLGDDTSEHIKPQELLDYNNLVKAADPSRRLTCQADPIYAHWTISRYAAYVRATDVFMPEIYPIRGKAGDKTDTNCVAQTILDMQRFYADVRQFGDGQPKACWPILQYFKGWGGWDHFPTRDQLYATTWAAVVHGAHGMTWYTYGGFEDKKKNRKNEGITSTPERWAAICALASQLRDLSPVLLERTPKEQPKVEILEGPALDPLGKNPSVTCLWKVHKGKGHLFAVNACPEPVTARFTLPDGRQATEKFPAFGTFVR